MRGGVREDGECDSQTLTDLVKLSFPTVPSYWVG